MVGLEEGQASGFVAGVYIEKGQAVRIDDFIGLLHRGEFERLLSFAAFAGPDSVAESFIDFEHVSEGIVSAIFQLEQEGRASMGGMVKTQEEVAGGPDSPVLAAKQPQAGNHQVRVR